MNHLIEGGGSPQEWDEILTPEIRAGLRHELSIRELRFIDRTEGNLAADTQLAQGVMHKLDEFILDQAKTVGWRIVLSTLTHQRMAAWNRDKDGPKKFTRLGQAMATAARLLQGTGRPPLTDPDWYAFRKEAVAELKLFFQQLADFVRTCRHRVDVCDLLKWITNEIRRQPRVFPQLRRHLEQLVAYLSEAGDSSIDLLRNGDRVSATEFFDQWMGWRTGRDPEKFRQKISKIGASPRKPAS